MVQMKDSEVEWIRKIPSNWIKKKIKFLLKQRLENNAPIKTTNILSLTAKQGVIPLSEKEGGGNKPKEDLSAYRLAYPGDIVLNSMNVLSGSVGLSKYFGCVSPVYYMLRPISTLDDVRFYNYIFQTKEFQSSLKGLGNGILVKETSNGKLNTIRLRIPIDKLGNQYLAVPPYTIQNKIADFLDKKCSEIDSLSADIQTEIDTLEEYKKSVITEAVTKGLNPDVEMKDSGVFYLGKTNPAWKITKLGYVCSKLVRSFNPDDTALICSNKGQIIERGNSVIGLMSSEDNAMQGIHSGDIAIHGMDTWHGAIALSTLTGKITRVVHVCASSEDHRFIVYFLKYLAIKNVYKLISNGVRGNTSDFRSWEKVKQISISLPSIIEQNDICDYLDSKCLDIDYVIAEKQKQLSTLSEYKKSLIYEYVTGKKEVI